ncbi:MAG: hypothetical protein HY532_04550 [Chloroflexi bacterium]|nr:hypothetical protein [Chloroflexota bacterium]
MNDDRPQSSATYFPCPYLGAEVELTQEREQHIPEQHPDLLPEYQALLADTLANPDRVRIGSALLFSRWYNEVQGGKHVVVVVITDPTTPPRYWIVTAYLARRLSGRG